MMRIAGEFRSEKGTFVLVEGFGPCCSGKCRLTFFENIGVGKTREVEMPLTQEQFEVFKAILDSK